MMMKKKIDWDKPKKGLLNSINAISQTMTIVDMILSPQRLGEKGEIGDFQKDRSVQELSSIRPLHTEMAFKYKTMGGTAELQAPWSLKKPNWAQQVPHAQPSCRGLLHQPQFGI